MKVILSEDVKHLGEEGDVKDVAKGYARNYLLPRGLAMPYTKEAIAYFESIKDQIEARKAEKREKAKSLKERLESLNLVFEVPAGPSGKLYGSVAPQAVSDELEKQGFEIERKRIEIPGNAIKSAGKYEISLRLYENAIANMQIEVVAKYAEPEKKDKKRKPRSKKTDAKAETSETKPLETEASATAESPEVVETAEATTIED